MGGAGRAGGAVGRRRAGSMIVDASAAVSLLGVLPPLAAELLAWRASEAQALERRRWALAEARNVVERVSALPGDRLTAAGVAGLDLGTRARAALPDGAVDVRLEPQADVPGLVRIDVAVSWRGKVDREDVRLARYCAAGHVDGGEATP